MDVIVSLVCDVDQVEMGSDYLDFSSQVPFVVLEETYKLKSLEATDKLTSLEETDKLKSVVTCARQVILPSSSS